MKKIIPLIILFLLGASLKVFSQTLKVTSFKQTNDLTASRFEKTDINGVPCGLIKVWLPVNDGKFVGNVVESIFKNGEWWVYMTKGSKRVTIKTSQYPPLIYEFDETFLSNVTYRMTVEIDSGQAQDMESLHQSEAERDFDTHTFTVKGISFSMVYVGRGTFLMGSDYSFRFWDYYDEEWPIHQVTLDHGFYIGQTEVTQKLWNAVMDDNKKNNIYDDLDLPVKDVSWDECQQFITKLNQLTGKNFRLPTEAEWEYAARGGKTDSYIYSGSDELDKIGWFAENSGGIPHPVQRKVPNAWGLYDMSGNVWEWCNDWFGEYSDGSYIDPTGPLTGSEHVKRGGGANSGAWNCRVTTRVSSTPQGEDHIGFRLVLPEYSRLLPKVDF